MQADILRAFEEVKVAAFVFKNEAINLSKDFRLHERKTNMEHGSKKT